MKKPIIAVTNDVSWALGQMNTMYTNGEIKGFTAQIMHNDGTYGTIQCGELSHVEKLGLVESAKHDLFLSTLEEE